jgi:hypothetical protein
VVAPQSKRRQQLHQAPAGQQVWLKGRRSRCADNRRSRCQTGQQEEQGVCVWRCGDSSCCHPQQAVLGPGYFLDPSLAGQVRSGQVRSGRRRCVAQAKPVWGSPTQHPQPISRGFERWMVWRLGGPCPPARHHQVLLMLGGRVFCIRFLAKTTSVGFAQPCCVCAGAPVPASRR